MENTTQRMSLVNNDSFNCGEDTMEKILHSMDVLPQNKNNHYQHHLFDTLTVGTCLYWKYMGVLPPGVLVSLGDGADFIVLVGFEIVMKINLFLGPYFLEE